MYGLRMVYYATSTLQKKTDKNKQTKKVNVRSTYVLPPLLLICMIGLTGHTSLTFRFFFCWTRQSRALGARIPYIKQVKTRRNHKLAVQQHTTMGIYENIRIFFILIGIFKCTYILGHKANIIPRKFCEKTKNGLVDTALRRYTVPSSSFQLLPSSALRTHNRLRSKREQEQEQ